MQERSSRWVSSVARRAPGALGITRSNMATLTLTCSGRWLCLQPQPFVRPEDLGQKQIPGCSGRGAIENSGPRRYFLPPESWCGVGPRPSAVWSCELGPQGSRKELTKSRAAEVPQSQEGESSDSMRYQHEQEMTRPKGKVELVGGVNHPFFLGHSLWVLSKSPWQ